MCAHLAIGGVSVISQVWWQENCSSLWLSCSRPWPEPPLQCTHRLVSHLLESFGLDCASSRCTPHCVPHSLVEWRSEPATLQSEGNTCGVYTHKHMLVGIHKHTYMYRYMYMYCVLVDVKVSIFWCTRPRFNPGWLPVFLTVL